MTMPEQHSGPGSGVSAPAAREPPAMRPPPPPPPLSAPWTPLRPTLRGDIVVQATGVMLQLMIARKQVRLCEPLQQSRGCGNSGLEHAAPAAVHGAIPRIGSCNASLQLQPWPCNVGVQPTPMPGIALALPSPAAPGWLSNLCRITHLCRSGRGQAPLRPASCPHFPWPTLFRSSSS